MNASTLNSWSDAVTATDFKQKVIDASATRLVVVDFWAAWCAPCRALKPILEKLAEKYAGAFFLAKVDTEAEPELAQLYSVRGIPDVRFFLNGQVVDQFTGVLPEEEIEKHLRRFVKDELSELLERARDAQDALQILAPFRDRFAASSQFGVAYAQALAEAGRPDEALTALDSIRLGDPLYTDAQDLKLLIRFAEPPRPEAVVPENSLSQLYRRAAESWRAGQTVNAIEHLIDVLAEDKDYRGEEARKVALALLKNVPDEMTARQLRRRIAMLVNV